MSERIPCICGHEESMHYAISGACMKVIRRDPWWLDNNLLCTCKEYRPETTTTAAPSAASQGA